MGRGVQGEARGDGNDNEWKARRTRRSARRGGGLRVMVRRWRALLKSTAHNFDRSQRGTILSSEGGCIQPTTRVWIVAALAD